MTPERAILLVRISDDREGEEKGVKRQEADCRKHARQMGWGIAQVVFIDNCPPGVVIENDTSAFKRRKVVLPDGSTALRVVRPGFRRILGALSSGEADGLIAYDLDRACRDPRDLEDLIDVVEQGRVPVSSVAGSLRLANDADITMARVMVAVANKSSRDTARRVARKHEELAEEGKPSGGGRRAFGYDADGMTVRPAEAEAIKMMARMLLGGSSLHEIADELNAAGVAPAYAERWGNASVQFLLAGPRITGLRVFRGEIVGDAAWPAIIDRETWDQVQAKLRDRSALGSPSNRLIHWLTGLLICSFCRHELSGWAAKGGGRYWCATPRGGCGRIAINAPRAEAEVERQFLDYLARPEILGLARKSYTVAPAKVSSARAELAQDQQQLKDLAGMWARREVTFAEYSEARRIIADRIKESQVVVTASLPSAIRSLLQSDDLVGAWRRMGPTDRRDAVRAILPGYTVVPQGPGLKKFDPDRLVPIKE